VSTVPNNVNFSIITVCVDRWEFLRRSLPTWQAVPKVARIVIATYDFDPVPAWLSGVTLLRIDAPQFHRTRALNAAATYAIETDHPTYLLFIDADMLVKDPLVFHRALDRNPVPDYVVDSEYALRELNNQLVVVGDPEKNDRGKRGTHAVRSELFAQINGFDQRLKGWGIDDLNLYTRYRTVSSNHAFYERAVFEHQPHDDRLRASNNPQGTTLDDQLMANMKIHKEHFDARGESWRHEMGYPKLRVTELPLCPETEIPRSSPTAPTAPSDDRPNVYQQLHRDVLPQQEQLNRTSAETILELLFSYVKPRSVLDVGCGLGTWLAVLREHGLTDVQGIEGEWLDPSTLVVEPSMIAKCDLQSGFSCGRRFDLVVSLEVAEHLSPEAAAPFVASLAKHGDLVLFSAAIPSQGGYHHVNERFPNYWADLFARHGFQACDCIRPYIWTDQKVHWWLRQNTLLFAHQRALTAYPQLAEQVAIARPLAIVHPEVYLTRLHEAGRARKDLEQLMSRLSQGGTFEVTPLPGGRFRIHRL
jgi:SAM-dependent methyltransferase